MGKTHKIRLYVGVYYKHGYVWVFCHVTNSHGKACAMLGKLSKHAKSECDRFIRLQLVIYIYSCLICDLLNEQ